MAAAAAANAMKGSNGLVVVMVAMLLSINAFTANAAGRSHPPRMLLPETEEGVGRCAFKKNEPIDCSNDPRVCGASFEEGRDCVCDTSETPMFCKPREELE